MTFREKSLWVSMIASAAIWGSYLFDVGSLLAHGTVSAAQAYGGFTRSVILLVVVQVAATIVLATMAPSDANAPEDMRDKEFAASAALPAYTLLSLVIVVAMLAIPLLVQVAPRYITGDPAMVIAIVLGNAMLLALVIAHVTYCAAQIHRYRHG
ncbi:hypothetical protein ASG11_13635 [Sphingomonas sp. Leaf357]|uniref:hypothetical protein n=1 Tax=Sphingomonas sp. Leaf357 TaxID=1736350 RepID=UPI0006FD17E5|nr:hypothetical protein [Sphingomonas sp. Leaf357]KQS01863.1 hypothetical protein ASG11_13635 [Sphingomonas sp. Leaf357]